MKDTTKKKKKTMRKENKAKQNSNGLFKFPDLFPGSKKTMQTIDVQQILGTLQFSRKKNWRKWREKETEAERERGQGIIGRAKNTQATHLQRSVTTNTRKMHVWALHAWQSPGG
jgi:hypothetical protein